MKLVFVHIKGDKKGHTDVLAIDKIRIGTDSSCNLHFTKGVDQVSDFHAEIKVGKSGVVTINDTESETGVYVNKVLAKTTNLKDGDLISFNENGTPEVCIRFSASNGKHAFVNHFFNLLEASGISAETLGKLRKVESSLGEGHDKKNRYHGNKTLFADFFRKISSTFFKGNNKLFKFLVIGIVLLALGGTFTFLFSYFHELKDTSRRVRSLETQQSLTQDIIEKYRKGVCFIQGSYYFVDKKTGKSTRHLIGGEPITNNYTGSGFLVSSKGFVMTNRHVAEPDWDFGSRSSVKNRPAYMPELTVKFEKLRAFFPDIKKPFPLEIVKVSEETDVAILKFKPTADILPVFNLGSPGKPLRIGEPVILLGYPAGINAIFGKADQKVVDELINMPVLKIAEELSNRKLIRPLITQGHIGDISPDKIIYDAQTTFGGSGGPLIDVNGNVVGINYGILRSFKGSNFGVPIEYGIKLLNEVPYTDSM